MAFLFGVKLSVAVLLLFVLVAVVEISAASRGVAPKLVKKPTSSADPDAEGTNKPCQQVAAEFEAENNPKPMTVKIPGGGSYTTKPERRVGGYGPQCDPKNRDLYAVEQYWGGIGMSRCAHPVTNKPLTMWSRKKEDCVAIAKKAQQA